MPDEPHYDEPNHPDRPCRGLHTLPLLVHYGHCLVCGWPYTHHLPPAELRGIINDDEQP